MNKNIIWIKIECNNYYKLIRKLNEIGTEVYKLKIEDDFIFIQTNYDNYQKLKKYLVSYKISIYKYLGIRKIKNKYKKYKVFIMTSIISILFLVLLNSITIKINIISSNNDIKNLLIDELSKNGIKKISFKKSHNQIEKIVNKILDDNKETLEWIEIKYDGLIMIVNVTAKTKNNEKTKHNHCDLIARNDAKIISMNVSRGVALKEINDYVSKGDVIISGSIMHNNDVKNTVCASGEVYGEVWYKVSVRLPLEEEIKEYSGKKRYNLKIKTSKNDYEIFKSRIKSKEEELINLYKLNDFEINIVKEKEYKIIKNKLTEKDAYLKAISKGLEKIKLNLDKNEEILLQKVLKKEVNNSTIYLEIFVVTKENIVSTNVIEEEY